MIKWPLLLKLLNCLHWIITTMLRFRMIALHFNHITSFRRFPLLKQSHRRIEYYNTWENFFAFLLLEVPFTSPSCQGGSCDNTVTPDVCFRLCSGLSAYLRSCWQAFENLSRVMDDESPLSDIICCLTLSVSVSEIFPELLPASFHFVLRCPLHSAKYVGWPQGNTIVETDEEEKGEKTKKILFISYPSLP